MVSVCWLAIPTREQIYLVTSITTDGSTIAIRKAQWGVLQGRILDEKTRKGIGGATVSVSGGPSAKTDSEGRFSLRVPEGEYRLITATADGYIPTHDEQRFVLAATVPFQVTETLTAATAPKSGRLLLHSGDSCHFLAQTMSQFSGGDFYLGGAPGRDPSPMFFANRSQYQRGLLDLGDLRNRPLDEVIPPNSGYSPPRCCRRPRPHVRLVGQRW